MGVFVIFGHMQKEQKSRVRKEERILDSILLNREVQVDIYLHAEIPATAETSLLLFNDGQDLGKMGFDKMLDTLYRLSMIEPVFCVAIHAGTERRMEYGTAGVPDFNGRGGKAAAYTDFIFLELLPFIREEYHMPSFKEKAFAGFSLGALSALDIVWNHPQEFSRAGIFSGSLWWRSLDQTDPAYNDDQHRIMHQLIRHGAHYPWLKFFFECGAGDEEDDRNGNGIIDSIDDTLDLIKELTAKGYDRNRDIHYLQIDDGKHDVATWARAMPEYLRWGWGKSRK